VRWGEEIRHATPRDGGLTIDENLAGSRRSGPGLHEEASMQKITPHLWFDREAVEAAEFYASTFPDSRVTDVTTIPGTPSGDTDIVSFQLLGQPFMAISAGPLFTFTPAVSFSISCSTREEVDELWARLSERGTTLMPLDSYPFSERYGWTTDRYGLSWQVALTSEGQRGQRITPTLMFVGEVCGKAEEAVDLYTSVFADSKAGPILRYGEQDQPDAEGTIKYAAFALDGYEFAAMDSAREHDFTFNEAISFIVNCETQEEIDHYWDSLSAVPEAEACGWLKDRFGLSWQVVPTDMDEMLRTGTKEQIARVTEAFLKMKKFDLEELRSAYEGGATHS
jgi:predicted 3-demethylubiquinone-9 3-methyltransferase (glyoxalase superfamily)